MITLLQVALRHVHFGLIRCASFVVPARDRSEWLQEWQAELWYMLRECSSQATPDYRSIRQATSFTLGAYRDAFWLRKRSWRRQQLGQRIEALVRICGSAPVCLLLLIAMFLSTWEIGRISPRVSAGMSRTQVYPWEPRDERAAPCDCALDLTAGRRSLKTVQQFFDGFAHYTITQQAVGAEGMQRSKWTIAHVRSNFFAVLHLPVRFIDCVAGCPDGLPQVVLSHDRWIRDFRGKPDIAGTRLHVGSVDAVIAGVAFGGSTGLPGKADAWLLGPDFRVGTSNTEFVAGHLSAAGYLNDGRWTLSLGGILLALLTVPFITRPSLGEYSNALGKPSLAQRCRLWAFLVARIALLLAVAYYASLDLAFSFLQPFSQLSGYMQPGAAFALSFAGLSWAFRDQQHRCPVCLRRMAHPVEVGQRSRTFLAWNGTELVCSLGHTLLHIPGIRTSWFGAQRWVCLDLSWQFLFVRSTRTSSFL